MTSFLDEEYELTWRFPPAILGVPMEIAMIAHPTTNSPDRRTTGLGILLPSGEYTQRPQGRATPSPRRNPDGVLLPSHLGGLDG